MSVTQPRLDDPSVRFTMDGTRPQVEVRTSTRRRKTSTAYWDRDRVIVVLPSHVREPQRTELVDWLVRRVLAKRPGATASDTVLAERARSLADRYVEGVRPTSIRWVGNQERRWGSCTATTGEIRISERLRCVPGWVLDATIVHELAHLLHPNHSPTFHRVAGRFPRQRDAALFLEGYALGLGMDRSTDADAGPDAGARTDPDAGGNPDADAGAGARTGPGADADAGAHR
ncbi:MAG: M48 family metallopeptidase [Actinomycetota bacterium]|nr:M48 family metallopeptidase [Actinomycetota bacterium]